MIKKIAPAIALFCLSLWPFTHFLDANIEELQRADLIAAWQPLVLCLLVFAFAALCGIAIRAVSRKNFDSLFSILLVFTGAFFVFSPLNNFSGEVITSMGINRGAIIGVAIIVLCIAAGLAFMSRFEFVRNALYAGIVFGSMTPLVMNAPQIFTAYFSAEPRQSSPVPDEQEKRETDLPNIFYIIADGMVGERGYAKITGTSLDPIIESLKQFGFDYVPEARSNFIASASSIGSLFHLKYFRDENTVKGDLKSSSFFPAITYRQTPAPLFVELRKLGYEINMSGSWYSGCRNVQVRCISDTSFRPNREAQLLLSRTPLSRVMPSLLDKKVDAISPVTAELETLVGPDSRSIHPQFTFIHHMQPHSPWYFDGSCNRIDESSFSDAKLYQFSVECIAKTIKAFMSTLEKLDPNAIVVMHGDHGWLLNNQGTGIPEYEWSEDLLDQRSEILNLIKSPEPCKKWLTSEIGPLNTMKYVLACAKNVPPEYLEEKLLIPGENYSQDERLVSRSIPY